MQCARERSPARGNTQRGIQEIRQAATLQCQVSKHKDGVRFDCLQVMILTQAVARQTHHQPRFHSEEFKVGATL